MANMNLTPGDYILGLTFERPVDALTLRRVLGKLGFSNIIFEQCPDDVTGFNNVAQTGKNRTGAVMRAPAAARAPASVMRAPTASSIRAPMPTTVPLAAPSLMTSVHPQSVVAPMAQAILAQASAPVMAMPPARPFGGSAAAPGGNFSHFSPIRPGMAPSLVKAPGAAALTPQALAATAPNTATTAPPVSSVSTTNPGAVPAAPPSVPAPPPSAPGGGGGGGSTPPPPDSSQDASAPDDESDDGGGYVPPPPDSSQDASQDASQDDGGDPSVPNDDINDGSGTPVMDPSDAQQALPPPSDAPDFADALAEYMAALEQLGMQNQPGAAQPVDLGPNGPQDGAPPWHHRHRHWRGMEGALPEVPETSGDADTPPGDYGFTYGLEYSGQLDEAVWKNNPQAKQDAASMLYSLTGPVRTGAEEPETLRVVARVSAPIQTADVPGVVTWKFAKLLPVSPFSDLSTQMTAFPLREGATYAARILCRDKTAPTIDAVRQGLMQMGFQPARAIALKKNIRLPGRPGTSVSSYLALGHWVNPNSVVTRDDPFFFEQLGEMT